MDGFRLFAAAAVAAIAVTAAAQPCEPGIFRVDAAQSDVHWLIYKAGALSRLGHNHVISASEVDGRVWLEDDLSDSRFELTIPVAELVVDDPELRRLKGEAFASEPSAKDVARTKANMLRDSLLNGEDHPTIEVTGTNIQGAPDDATIDLSIRIAGNTVEVTAPATLEVSADAVRARGAFTMTHADLGLEPFRVMMGALQVAQEIDFEYDILAVRAHARE